MARISVIKHGSGDFQNWKRQIRQTMAVFINEWARDYRRDKAHLSNILRIRYYEKF